MINKKRKDKKQTSKDTLLINPFRLFFNASQLMRWYASPLLSSIWACMARSRAGGM
jgi:hypothetical protein